VCCRNVLRDIEQINSARKKREEKEGSKENSTRKTQLGELIRINRRNGSHKGGGEQEGGGRLQWKGTSNKRRN